MSDKVVKLKNNSSNDLYPLIQVDGETIKLGADQKYYVDTNMVTSHICTTYSNRNLVISIEELENYSTSIAHELEGI